jgi:hypothetical protein
MHRGRFIIAAALALVSIHARAAEPAVIVDLDFSKADVAAGVQLNNEFAQFVTEGGKQRLRLTNDIGEKSSVFTPTPVPPTADYLATFQFEVRRLAGDPAPADGFMFVAQTAGPDRLGDGGGSLGYAGSAFGALSYGVEFNSYTGQGLGDGVDETVAWNAFGERRKYDQKPFPHVGLGVFTAEVRVQPNEMSVTISGGKANLPPTLVMTSTPLIPEELGGLFKLLTPKPIYFGFAAATGGAGQVTDILNLRIVSPAPAPTAGG